MPPPQIYKKNLQIIYKTIYTYSTPKNNFFHQNYIEYRRKMFKNRSELRTNYQTNVTKLEKDE